MESIKKDIESQIDEMRNQIEIWKHLAHINPEFSRGCIQELIYSIGYLELLLKKYLNLKT